VKIPGVWVGVVGSVCSGRALRAPIEWLPHRPRNLVLARGNRRLLSPIPSWGPPAHSHRI